jgi:hypothetical protein
LLVEAFGRRCRRLARDLAGRGVRLAEPGVTPNSVLLEHAGYHRVWKAWEDLRNREHAVDDLWRWQARSWEEFCLVALVAALSRLETGRLISAAPIRFRDEQHRGRWIDWESPFAVAHLPDSGLVVEVLGGSKDARLARFAAPVWLRIGRIGDTAGFLRRIAVWPLWSPVGGVTKAEAAEVNALLIHGRDRLVTGGIVLRPAAGPDKSDYKIEGGVLSLAIGTEGEALHDALWVLREHLGDALRGVAT